MITQKNDYVLLFLFSKDLKDVLLIHKKHPVWQKNLYNGVGGKIKFGECYYKAAVRELEEETSIKLNDNIYEILTLHYESCRVLVYTGMTDDIYNAKQTTEEELLIIPPKDIDIFNCVWDLKYLMPLCLERLKEYGS
jgi:8-oxo-dGTP diphosphatase